MHCEFLWKDYVLSVKDVTHVGKGFFFFVCSSSTAYLLSITTAHSVSSHSLSVL